MGNYLWGRNEADKDVIKEYVENEFGYNLDCTLDEIRPMFHKNNGMDEDGGRPSF